MYTGRRQAARAAHAPAAAGRTTPWAAEAGTAEAEESSVCSGLLYGPHRHGDADAEMQGVRASSSDRRIGPLSGKISRSCWRGRPEIAGERAASSADDSLAEECGGRCSEARFGDRSMLSETRPTGLRRRLRSPIEPRRLQRHDFCSIISRRSAGRTTDRGSAASRC